MLCICFTCLFVVLKVFEHYLVLFKLSGQLLGLMCSTMAERFYWMDSSWPSFSMLCVPRCLTVWTSTSTNSMFSLIATLLTKIKVSSSHQKERDRDRNREREGESFFSVSLFVFGSMDIQSNSHLVKQDLKVEYYSS